MKINELTPKKITQKPTAKKLGAQKTFNLLSNKKVYILGDTATRYTDLEKWTTILPYSDLYAAFAAKQKKDENAYEDIMEKLQLKSFHFSYIFGELFYGAGHENEYNLFVKFLNGKSDGFFVTGEEGCFGAGFDKNTARKYFIKAQAAYDDDEGDEWGGEE